MKFTTLTKHPQCQSFDDSCLPLIIQTSPCVSQCLAVDVQTVRCVGNSCFKAQLVSYYSRHHHVQFCQPLPSSSFSSSYHWCCSACSILYIKHPLVLSPYQHCSFVAAGSGPKLFEGQLQLVMQLHMRSRGWWESQALIPTCFALSSSASSRFRSPR